MVVGRALGDLDLALRIPQHEVGVPTHRDGPLARIEAIDPGRGREVSSTKRLRSIRPRLTI